MPRRDRVRPQLWLDAQGRLTHATKAPPISAGPSSFRGLVPAVVARQARTHHSAVNDVLVGLDAHAPRLVSIGACATSARRSAGIVTFAVAGQAVRVVAPELARTVKVAAGGACSHHGRITMTWSVALRADEYSGVMGSSL